MGFLQIAVGGLVSAAIGVFNAANSLPVAIMLFITSAIAFVVLTVATPST